MDLVAVLPWVMPVLAGSILIAPRVGEGLRAWTALAGSSIAVVGVASHLLRTTAFGLGGDSQDSGFLIEQLTKAKHYVLPGDGTYAGLSAFYPPTYFQLLGKAAALLQIDAAWTWKPASLAAALVVPMLAFVAWARLTNPRTAVVITILSAFAAPVLHLHKTHEWLTVVLFVPWWLRHVSGTERDGEATSNRELVVGAACGALLFTTFYYWFFIGTVALGLSAIARRWRGQPAFHAHGLIVLCASALLSSPYWIPLLLDFILIDFTPLQQRWFSASHNRFPLRIGFDPGDLLLLAGIGALIPWPSAGAGAEDPAARRLRAVLSELRILFIACVAWFLLGRLAFALSRPILHVKMIPLMHGTLHAAFAAFVVGVLGTRLGAKRGALVAAAALAVALGVNLRGYSALAGSSLHAKAVSLGMQEPEKKLARRTAALDLKGKTVLAAEVRHLQYSPAFAFIGLSAHYAHPASRFEQRYAFLKSLVTLEVSQSVCLLLRHNRFVPVDYIWWPDDRELVVYLDDFPRGVRSGHLRWSGAGKHGDCLPRATKTGPTKRWQRVLDPGWQAAARMDPPARSLAMRFGDGRLRAAAAPPAPPASANAD